MTGSVQVIYEHQGRVAVIAGTLIALGSTSVEIVPAEPLSFGQAAGMATAIVVITSGHPQMVLCGGARAHDDGRIVFNRVPKRDEPGPVTTA